MFYIFSSICVYRSLCSSSFSSLVPSVKVLLWLKFHARENQEKKTKRNDRNRLRGRKKGTETHARTHTHTNFISSRLCTAGNQCKQITSVQFKMVSCLKENKSINAIVWLKCVGFFPRAQSLFQCFPRNENDVWLELHCNNRYNKNKWWTFNVHCATPDCFSRKRLKY